MDIMLERIMSLLPKKADGKIIHGAKKEFADSLGLSHNLITMWGKGQSKSYRNYVQQISETYNVSVDWLMGITDIKEKSPASEDTELNEKQLLCLELIGKLNDQNIVQALAYLQGLVDAQSQRPTAQA